MNLIVDICVALEKNTMFSAQSLNEKKKIYGYINRWILLVSKQQKFWRILICARRILNKINMGEWLQLSAPPCLENTVYSFCDK